MLGTPDRLKSTIQSSRAGFALAPIRVCVCTTLVWSANRLFQVKQRPLLEDRCITELSEYIASTPNFQAISHAIAGSLQSRESQHVVSSTSSSG
jgi:hypothetical protein